MDRCDQRRSIFLLFAATDPITLSCYALWAMFFFAIFARVKVLILHQHFKTPQTGGALRSYYLAKALVDGGIHTVVITAHNTPAFKSENVEGIEVHYLPVAYHNSFGFYRRVSSFFRFTLKALRMASKHRDADACYAISTPLTTGIAAGWIKRRYGIPFVFEVGDLWPDAPIALGFLKNPMARALAYRLERSIYRGADSVVALSEPIRDAIRKRVPEKYIRVIPNMADTDFYQPAQKDVGLEERFGVRDKFVVSYVGALGLANGLYSFLDCAAASQAADLPVHFILCGDGAMLDGLQRYAQKLQLSNLTIVAFQDRRGVREIMNVTDAIFISYLPVKILETGSPNKYFDGLAAGKLIIVNFHGWIRDEIEQEKCGVYTDANHAEDFVRKLKPFLSDKQRLTRFQLAARALAERKYSRNALSEQYRNIFL